VLTRMLVITDQDHAKMDDNLTTALYNLADIYSGLGTLELEELRALVDLTRQHVQSVAWRLEVQQ
jgi:hypothetical protein